MDENERASLTNWGRWGAEDQLGSLNLITPEIIQKAAGLVKTGQTYSLSVPLEANGPQWPLRPKMWRVTAFRSDPSGGGSSGSPGDSPDNGGVRVAGCVCATPAPAAPWALLLVPLALLRRRRR